MKTRVIFFAGQSLGQVFGLGLLGVILCGTASGQGSKADLFIGYSRLGANTLVGNTPALGGWQGAMNVQVKPRLGFEGDLSHYGLESANNVERSTMLLLGPRVTVGGAGVHVYVHGLLGGEHSANQIGNSSGAMAMALGGGLDVHFAPYLSWRMADDYVDATSNPAHAAHNRFSLGIAFYF
jgi:hypothetical protein